MHGGAQSRRTRQRSYAAKGDWDAKDGGGETSLLEALLWLAESELDGGRGDAPRTAHASSHMVDGLSPEAMPDGAATEACDEGMDNDNHDSFHGEGPTEK